MKYLCMTYAKAGIAFIGAFSGSLLTATADGSRITLPECLTAIVLSISTLTGVASIPNRKPNTATPAAVISAKNNGVV